MRHADQEWAGLTVACKNGTCAGSWGPLGSGAAAVGLRLWGWPCPALPRYPPSNWHQFGLCCLMGRSVQCLGCVPLVCEQPRGLSPQDYELFVEAVEQNTLQEFLKLA